MTKLCPRGKAAAKRKFKVYPSAYANAYASKICAGKIKDPSGVKRKDFKGRKPAAEGGPIDKNRQKSIKEMQQKKVQLGLGVFDEQGNFQAKKRKKMGSSKSVIKGGPSGLNPKAREELLIKKFGPRKSKPRPKMMGGGLMEATQRLRRQGLKAGGRGCKLAMKGRGRAYGKNS